MLSNPDTFDISNLVHPVLSSTFILSAKATVELRKRTAPKEKRQQAFLSSGIRFRVWALRLRAVGLSVAWGWMRLSN